MNEKARKTVKKKSSPSPKDIIADFVDQSDSPFNADAAQNQTTEGRVVAHPGAVDSQTVFGSDKNPGVPKSTSQIAKDYTKTYHADRE